MRGSWGSPPATSGRATKAGRNHVGDVSRAFAAAGSDDSNLHVAPWYLWNRQRDDGLV